MIGIGRKHSKKRDAVLQAIRSTAEHPSAFLVYERLKTSISGLSLATVYRNINLFIAEGEVVPVCVIDGKERFDGIVEPHPHFVCTNCGEVSDLPFQPLPPAADTAGFIIDYRKTLFYGTCRHCAEQ